MGIATEAIGSQHSTAHSHHRIIVGWLMGHHAGWLALGDGLAARPSVGQDSMRYWRLSR